MVALTDRLSTLQSRIAARRARSLAAWQAAQPNLSGRLCAHCGDLRADRTEVYEGRVTWCCPRCFALPPPTCPVCTNDLSELGCEECSWDTVTLAEAALLCGYSARQLERVVKSGELASVVYAGVWRVRPTEALEWARRRRSGLTG